MADNNLSSRAGLNVGIEPTLLPFVQAGAGEILLVNRSGDTLVAEHTDRAARVPFATTGVVGTGIPGITGGFVWDTDGSFSGVILSFFFVDDQGTEFLVGAGEFDVPSNPNPIAFLPAGVKNALRYQFFCLAPNEKIIARLGTPPT